MVQRPKQYLNYQHNVQRYFRDHREKYEGIIIPLSIATSFPSGTYGFVRALCAKDSKKQYAIDPRNALFQKAWNRDNVREPHRKMAKVLGPPFTTDSLTRALLPEDFEDGDTLKNCVQQCLEFQMQFKLRADDERKLEKYKKLLGLKSWQKLGEPQFLIPPYFQFDSLKDAWWTISRRCIVAATKFAGELPIRPVLHFSRWADIDSWDKVFELLLKKEIKCVWYYPNNFHEHQASQDELELYRDAIFDANNMGLEPYILFGGYFAILMRYFGSVGFGNGIGYGEWRDSGYHRGGTASTRVYILKLHQFLDAPAAQSLVDRDPEYFGGDTELIAECIEAERPLDDLSLEETLDHFMECRNQEMDFISENPISDAITELNETLEHLAEMPLEREKYGTSLERWANVLGSDHED